MKIGQLKELVLALDELALETDSGRYPQWIYSEVKDLYTLLRATFGQLVGGRRIQVTRQELLDKVHRIRDGIGESRLKDQFETRKSRSASPQREPRLSTLISHCTGAEYCRKVFHTQRRRGRLVHTPGPPNPPAESARDHRSRRWLIETALLSGKRPKTARRKGKVDLELVLLKDRAHNLEEQLQSELRRELRSEQALTRLREEDRCGFDQIVDRLDYLADILKHRQPARPETPPPSPRPKREIIVDNDRINQLEAELQNTKSRLTREIAEREERVALLLQEVEKLRFQLDELKKTKAQLENQLDRLKSRDGSDRKLLEEKIERLEENIKDLTRSERRLAKREIRLKEDKAELERRLLELESELSRSKRAEAELQAKITALQQEAVPVVLEAPKDAPARPLLDVVSKILFRHYLNKFRKEYKVRGELQATLEMTANAAERARKLSEQELNATRNSLLAEIEALRQQLDSRELANKQLQDQTEGLIKDRDNLERRLTANFEADRRRSLDEITQLQSQLILIKSEPKPEPVVDMDAFKRMLLDSFQGDYLHLEDNPSVLHIMFTQGDERVLFSDRIEKLNHRNFKEKRIIVISHNALYLLMPKAWEMKRVVKIDDIDKITMSRRSADHICIHHRSEEDIFFISPKRYEIMHFLMNAVQQKTSAPLAYHFAERFYVEDRDMHYRLVEVPDTTTVKLGRSVLLGPT